MSRSVIATSVPSTELVSTTDMSALLHGYAGTEEAFLTLVISAARDYVEQMSGYSLMPRSYVQYCDRFPMQSVYAALVPIPLPLIGWVPGRMRHRSPYEIALLRNPVMSVTKIVYIDLTGTPQTLNPGVDFAADVTCVPARVLPLPTPPGTNPVKSFWPACLPGPQSVAIFYTAGYYTTQDELTTDSLPRDLGFPPIMKLLVMQLAAHWFLNRDLSAVPCMIDDLLVANRVVDYNPSIE